MDQMKVKQTVRRMTEARAVLVRDNPFFGHLAMGMKLACAPCETACTDGSRLIFDPEFAEKLSGREIQFVTLHEVMHCVLEHCIRGRNLHSLLFNIACDIVVNSTILDMWGMDCFEIAGEEAMHLAPDGKEGRLYNAEEIYHMLLQKQGNVPDYGGKRLNGAGGNGSGTGKGVSDDSFHGASDQRKDALDIPSFDRHDLWQGICDKTQLRDDWNGRIRNAIKECGDSMGMPQSIRRVVQELADRAGLNWKQLLHDFLQFDQYDYTFVPPDRRYAGADFYLPAFNVDEDDGSANDIWVCVDTSASISEEELASAMTEILDAMRQARLKGKISFFDSNITEPELFESETELKKITPSGGGGTSFQIIFDYLQRKMYPELPKAILVFTDGYAWWPEEQNAMEVPVLWLISKDGKDDAPWGRVAKL
jgi:predicted metal-dependent peptidase